MPMEIVLPADYGYVLLAASGTFLVNVFHFIVTASERKKSGVKYPHAYATPEECDKSPAAYRFNCAQRAHANTTENLTPLLGSLLISGLRFPVASAILGGVWSLSRIGYTLGYLRSPKSRSLPGTPGSLSYMSLVVMSVYTSFKLAMG